MTNIRFRAGPELRKGICPKCAETTLYEDCQARPARMTIITHAHGCQYPSGGRCTCRWTEEQLRDPRVMEIVRKR